MHLDYPESLVSPSTFKLHSGDAMGEVTTIHYVTPDGTALSFLPSFASHEGEYSAKVCAEREVLEILDYQEVVRHVSFSAH